MSKKIISHALSRDAVGQTLARLNQEMSQPLWHARSSPDNVSDALEANYKFKDFVTTWEFLLDVAKYAHKSRHHPTITTTYNKVNVALTTHDIGNRVSEKDAALAELIQAQYMAKYKNRQNTRDMKQLISDVKGKTTLSKASKLVEDLMSLENTQKHKN